MVSPHESPANFSVTGNLCEDDIQHLLGAMIESHESQRGKQDSLDATSIASASSTALATLACTEIDEETTEIDEETKLLARSERKRSREKQRRMDVNTQFGDLTKLVSQLEKEEREEDPTVFHQSFSATNRADLISRTIAHLERMRDSNKRRQTECASLQQQLQEAKKAGEDMAAKYKELLCNSQNMMMPQPNKQVMMMVPMMMPADGSQTMPQFGMQAQMNAAMNPFMMPQQFMAPAAQAGTPQVVTAAVPTQPLQQQQGQQAQVPQQQQQQQQQQQHHVQPSVQQHGTQFAMQAQPQMMFPNMQSFMPNFTNPMAATTTATAPFQHHQSQQQTAVSFLGANGGFGMNAYTQPTMATTLPPAAPPATATTELVAPPGPANGSNTISQQAKPSGTNNSNGASYAHCA